MSRRYSLLSTLILMIFVCAATGHAQENIEIEFRVEPQTALAQSGDSFVPIPLRITLSHTGTSRDVQEIELMMTAGQGVIFTEGSGFELDNSLPSPEAHLSAAVDVGESRTYDLVVQALPGTFGRVRLMSDVLLNGAASPTLSANASFNLDFGSDLIELIQTQPAIPNIDGLRIIQRGSTTLQSLADRSEIDIYLENAGSTPQTYEVNVMTFSQLVLNPDEDPVLELEPRTFVLATGENRIVRVFVSGRDGTRMGRYSVLVRVTPAGEESLPLLLAIAYGAAVFDPPQSAPIDLTEQEMYLDTALLHGSPENPIHMSQNEQGELWVWIENTRLAAITRTISLQVFSRTGDLLFAENAGTPSAELVVEGIVLGPYEGMVIPVHISLRQSGAGGTFSTRLIARDNENAETSERLVQVNVVE